jgi:hypothetical protein
MLERPALDDSRCSALVRRVLRGGASASALYAALSLAPCSPLAWSASGLAWSACGLALTACGLTLNACGGAAKQTKVTPTTPEQERVFEHGVDFVATLEGLEGRWREGWDRDLYERVGGADYIGVVHIDAVLTGTDPEQRITHRLGTRIKRSLHGDTKELQLRVREGQPGFGSVHDNLQRIQARDFVAYVKWYVDSDGERAAHFHLSPASEAIVTETERAVALRGKGVSTPPKERVVVHNN